MEHPPAVAPDEGAFQQANEDQFDLRSFLCLLNDLTTQRKFIWSYQQMLQKVL
jgi:hypothetical protein